VCNVTGLPLCVGGGGGGGGGRGGMMDARRTPRQRGTAAHTTHHAARSRLKVSRRPRQRRFSTTLLWFVSDFSEMCWR